MTCIVGLRDGDKVWMGADSNLSHSYLRFRVREGKLLKRVVGGKELIIGYAGNYAGLQILRYLKLPKISVARSSKLNPVNPEL